MSTSYLIPLVHDHICTHCYISCLVYFHQNYSKNNTNRYMSTMNHLNCYYNMDFLMFTTSTILTPCFSQIYSRNNTNCYIYNESTKFLFQHGLPNVSYLLSLPYSYIHNPYTIILTCITLWNRSNLVIFAISTILTP